MPFVFKPLVLRFIPIRRRSQAVVLFRFRSATMGDKSNPKAPDFGKITRIPPENMRLEKRAQSSTVSDSGAGSEAPTLICNGTSKDGTDADAPTIAVETHRPTPHSTEDPMI